MNLKHVMVYALAGAMLAAAGCRAGAAVTSSDSELPFTLPTIPRPSIPDRSVSVADFGGTGDGHSLSTRAFADAIESLARQGGGRVGVYPVSEQSWMDMGQLEELDNMRRRLEQQ